jgi:hypothetical protein
MVTLLAVGFALPFTVTAPPVLATCTVRPVVVPGSTNKVVAGPGLAGRFTENAA